MANSDRARQFMPFDALKGLKEEIRKREKIKVPKKELSPDGVEMLEYKLQQVKKGMMIKVIYFANNEYLALEGMVSNIDIIEHKITIVKQAIPIKDIYDITGEDIKEIY